MGSVDVHEIEVVVRIQVGAVLRAVRALLAALCVAQRDRGVEHGFRPLPVPRVRLRAVSLRAVARARRAGAVAQGPPGVDLDEAVGLPPAAQQRRREPPVTDSQLDAVARQAACSQHPSEVMSFPYRRQRFHIAALLRPLLRIREGRKEQEVPHGCFWGSVSCRRRRRAQNCSVLSVTVLGLAL